jgi:hypothetical protein
MSSSSQVVLSKFFRELRTLATSVATDARDLRNSVDRPNAPISQTDIVYASSLLEEIESNANELQSEVQHMKENNVLSTPYTFAELLEVCSRMYEANEQWLAATQEKMEQYPCNWRYLSF